MDYPETFQDKLFKLKRPDNTEMEYGTTLSVYTEDLLELIAKLVNNTEPDILSAKLVKDGWMRGVKGTKLAIIRGLYDKSN